jgi:excinuclease ABC subunit B
MGVKVHYLHSEIETIERVEILRDLRLGVYDVVVGVNLLREGIDLPEVTLVAILDADKEGYLRSEGSLIQVIGRAARHLEGRVVMYADRRTDSMDRAINETERRRNLQIAWNKANGIEPTSIMKAIREVGMRLKEVAEVEGQYERRGRPIAAGEMPKDELARLIKDLELDMKTAAKNLEFERAAALRDEVVQLRGLQVLERGPESMLPEGPKTTRRVVRRRRAP